MLIKVNVTLVDPERQVLLWKTTNVAETKLKLDVELQKCKITTNQKETHKVFLLNMKYKLSINKSKNKLNRFRISRIQASIHPIWMTLMKNSEI